MKIKIKGKRENAKSRKRGENLLFYKERKKGNPMVGIRKKILKKMKIRIA